VDRLAGERGFCRAGVTAPVNLAQLHFHEEPPLSGTRGSGTVFFAGCTMACRYCQNHSISRARPGEPGWGTELTGPGLARVFLSLAAAGAHNLNLVSATPHLAVVMEALGLARAEGLRLPVVYNTSGYERVAVLKAVEGLIEVYLPDAKYASEAVAQRFSGAADYVRRSRAALLEMRRQVGHLRLGPDGLAGRGLLVRHLVLPAGLAGTAQVLADLAESLGPGTWVSLMAQYTPNDLVKDDPELGRPLAPEEYRAALAALEVAGLSRGFVQDLESAGEAYVPEFEGRPDP
jgi:putative pyruvate formate lyase activating enzyme